MSKKCLSLCLVFPVLLAFAFISHAQWLTQSVDLKPGWNAVFLHVDATHTNLNGQIGGDNTNPIQEIWRWNPPSVAQFTDSPAQPTPTGEWTSWNRTNAASVLQRLVGDSAYLVRVSSNVVSYTWNLKGRPVAPRHDWTISGLNLLGFSTIPNNPPKFGAFLAQSVELQSVTPEIYYYPGGNLSSNNPARLASVLFNSTVGSVKRGQAFWIRAGTTFNHYFGPFEVIQSGEGGVDFSDNSSSSTFRLRNLTANPLTVTLRLVSSETPPAGQSNIVTVPPLLLRGSINFTNLTYGYTNVPVNTARTWTLAAYNQPGSEVEVVLGLNRAAITAASGSILAGILRFTDSLGFSQVDVPVSATAASSAGLWVGGAAVTQVGQYLKTYAHGTVTNYVSTITSGDYELPSTTNTLLTVDTNALLTAGTNGGYIVTSVDTSLGTVPHAYPLRLIIQNPASGNAVLLQRVYVGFDNNTNIVVASGQSALNPGYLSSARRISSTQLPWTAANTPWTLNGNLGQQTTLSTTVTLPYDDQASNPFLHTYHPDHDNLNATFKTELPQGSESYTVQRVITLNINPPANDFSSLVAGAQTIAGNYSEAITIKGLGSNTRVFQVSGVFTLNRISQVSTLTIAP